MENKIIEIILKILRGDTSNNENRYSCEDIFDLKDLLTDSLLFITFIVSVENEFDIELPDEILMDRDAFDNVHSFAERLAELTDVID